MPPHNLQSQLAPSDFADLTDGLRRIAHTAGKLIIEVYKGEIAVDYKGDRSPVTQADGKAEELILSELKKLAPTIPIIAEEAASAGNIPAIDHQFFLVDPLDGTKEFINRNGEFTVNIALIVDQQPRAGVVYAPALGRMFFSAGPGQAYEQSIEATATSQLDDASPAHALAVTAPADDGLIVIASRSHRSPETEAYLERFTVKSFVSAGSSLKFCLVAAGEADLYPRHGRTMEWDTAAGHAVLAGAGGAVTQEDGTPFLYGKREEGFANPYFIARGKVTPST